jgi:hypothetical protein
MTASVSILSERYDDSVNCHDTQGRVPVILTGTSRRSVQSVRVGGMERGVGLSVPAVPPRSAVATACAMMGLREAETALVTLGMEFLKHQNFGGS